MGAAVEREVMAVAAGGLVVVDTYSSSLGSSSAKSLGGTDMRVGFLLVLSVVQTRDFSCICGKVLEGPLFHVL